MTLGLSIIARNEDSEIELLLNSIAELFDQIVVADTGSSDLTPVISRKLGAEVYFHNWNDSFSDARNFALSHMRTDWIFSLDCDELIEPEELLKLKKIINSTDASGINIKIINNLGNGTKSIHRYTRVYKNHPQIRYKGRIHEQIRHSIENLNYKIEDSDISITHNGYFDNDINKQIRNKELILLDIQDNPDDKWLIYHLANTDFAMKNFDTSLINFLKILNSDGLTDEQKEMSNLRIAQIALQKEDFTLLRRHINFTSQNRDIEGLRISIEAAAEMIQKNFINARNLYKKVSLIHSNLVNYEIVKNAIEFLDKMIDK